MKKTLAIVGALALGAGGLVFGLRDPVPEGTRLIAVCMQPAGGTMVRWFNAGESVPENCGVVTSKSNPSGLLKTDTTQGDAETDLVTLLRAACAPCAVTGTAWGRCPSCLAEPGGCAEACR